MRRGLLKAKTELLFVYDFIFVKKRRDVCITFSSRPIILYLPDRLLSLLALGMGITIALSQKSGSLIKTDASSKKNKVAVNLSQRKVLELVIRVAIQIRVSDNYQTLPNHGLRFFLVGRKTSVFLSKCEL